MSGYQPSDDLVRIAWQCACLDHEDFETSGRKFDEWLEEQRHRPVEITDDMAERARRAFWRHTSRQITDESSYPRECACGMKLTDAARDQTGQHFGPTPNPYNQ